MPSPVGAGASGAYSPADRLLHRIALGSAAVLDLSFDLERPRYGKAASGVMAGPPVFVAGLARAGTTIITRLLHDSGAFASLTYRDMPFPLAPNSWQAMTGRARRQVARAERGHGDGIEHDLDSPEAIEEVFWRAHEGKRYVTRRYLHPHEPTLETIAAFRDFASLVCHRYGRPRYLSKNNANALRLPGIIEAFPYALLVHPFRDPLQQAASLLQQHRRAIELGREDPFRARYMSWLGHYEFGRDHRPVLISGAPTATEPTDRIDYWLKTWCAAHRRLLDQPEAVRGRQLFIDYDELCLEPHTGVALLAHLARVELGTGEGLKPPRPYDSVPETPALLDRARAIHAELVARATIGD